MAIKKITEPYEILVRFKDGIFNGAHAQYIEVIKDSEEILAKNILNPVSVSGEAFSSVLGEAATSAAIAFERKDAEIESLKQDLDIVKAENASLKAQRIKLQETIEELSIKK